MKQLTPFLFLLFLASNPAYGQFDTTFHNKPVEPYPTAKCDSEQVEIKNKLAECGISNIMNDRVAALDFFNTMNMIAEPSTISFWGTDYTYQFDRSNQKKPFLLNADICIPIALGGKRWRLNTIQVIPQFKVRIFRDDTISHNDRSSPVRTPSYLPGITYYFSFRNLYHHDELTGNQGWYFGLKAFHHSNGQDGNEFNPDGTINVYNGNFGEQLVGEGIVGFLREYNRNKPSVTSYAATTQRGTTTRPNRLWYLRASFEWHEPSAVTNQDFRQYTLYGQNRLNIQFGHSWFTITRDLVLCSDGSRYIAVTPAQIKERFRFVANINYILDQYYHTGDRNSTQLQPMLSAKRLNLYLTGYYRIPGAPYAAAFLQMGYYGTDNYNIYFQQSFLQLRFGLALAFFKYPKSGDLQPALYIAD